ncbi:reverse transcriptase domain-containing protein [Tanacetum coccineum]
MEAFIGGLPQSIEGNVTASKPQTLEEATNIAHRLMDQILKRDSVQETNDHKRKFEDKRNTTDNNNYPNDHNNNNQSNNNKNNRNNDYHQQQNRRQETVRTYPAKRYHGNLPLCTRCTLHHTGVCTVKCQTCNEEVAVSMSWNDFKFKMIKEFCPSHEMQKLVSELWNYAMVRAGHVVYTIRFHELARLVPHLVTPESRMIERYVYGLASQIYRMVVATEPKTIKKAVQIFGALTDETIRACYVCGSTDHVRSACPRLNRVQGPK